MPKYIAFLRAINVGGHIVKMETLKSLFEDLGFKNVETFIASGNVIFDSPTKNVAPLERKIEKHLHQSLGYEVATFVRTPGELSKITKYKPFSDSDITAEGHTLYVGFLGSSPAKTAAEKLLGAVTPFDDFHLAGVELYWLCRGKFSDSLFSGARLEKCLGMQTTLRNVNTVRRLVAKYPEQ
jgi:uncharacterized protein (DUF1697 family)